MLIYNTLSALAASQLMIVLILAIISTAIVFLIVRKMERKVVLLSLLLGIGLTLLSLLIGRGYYGGMFYHEKFGFPAQFYSLNRNIDPQEQPAIPLPFNQDLNLLNAIANIGIYALIASMVIILIDSVKGKQTKAILATAAALLLLIVSAAGFSIHNHSTAGIPEAEIDEALNAPFMEQDAKEILLTAHPDIVKGIQAGLPPQMLYTSRQGQDWLIVHTIEGSGVDQIFAADCYRVKADGTITVLGNYQYEATMSYILQDIQHLNAKTCTIQE